MRYTKSKAASAEIMRLVLPHLTRYGADFQPPSYTLWYEYVAGDNQPLKQALDARMGTGSSLTAEETHALYASHVAARDVALLEQLQTQLQHALDEFEGLANSAGQDTKEYGRSLQTCGDLLSLNIDTEALHSLIRTLAAETQRMQESNTALSQRLETTQRDLLELKEHFAVIQSESLLDPLTRLNNRRGFQHGIEEILAGRPDGFAGCAMLMGDIDHFKTVNDKHGHLLGDKVLQTVAEILRSCIKERDTAARYGGEEFAILLMDTPSRGALALAEQIRKTVAQGRIRRTNRNETIDGVTISLGVAAYRPGETLEQWIARADRALYESKRRGRNRVTLAEPEAVS